jgi:hypothetical protein
MLRRQATAFKTLSPSRARALELVAAGASTGVVASTLGVHRSTAWKWMQEPEFRRAVESIREEAWSILRDGLRNQAARAVAVLGEQLESPDPRARRDAAKILLGAYARLQPSEAPDPSPEERMTEEEMEEQFLETWRFIQREEDRNPGYIATNPEFIRAQLIVLQILERRRGGDGAARHNVAPILDTS